MKYSSDNYKLCISLMHVFLQSISIACMSRADYIFQKKTNNKIAFKNDAYPHTILNYCCEIHF